MLNIIENCWISIGSNLKNPKEQANLALKHINKIPFTNILSCSSYYRSKPLGITSQPDFLNAVIKISTKLYPYELLKHIKIIEKKQKRKNNEIKWGPRSLDLDILLFGNKYFYSSDLIIPHYDLYNRCFFLYPLMEISPNLKFPDGSSLISKLKKIKCKKLPIW
ncbi:folK [Wigglesworthia glossinidia endosymbiont of Glossina brevipalpis]|uniref:2-amino-4-hydroxy-6-hydroxymethyldihydropteridine pyrophosphokinase n=1 Tax=Wigglesworthia glossinidia brevipalpis TaxID=36870 RepID=Q8D2U0_WIGBR|nr:folK [Wigglesworthia glossinidia endosymbiont of Glossina brevipalpis]